MATPVACGRISRPSALTSDVMPTNVLPSVAARSSAPATPGIAIVATKPSA
jgi:hypothetical protein